MHKVYKILTDLIDRSIKGPYSILLPLSVREFRELQQLVAEHKDDE
jgi:hypothetical protein